MIFLDAESVPLDIKQLMKFKRYIPQIDKISELLAKENPSPEKLLELTNDLIKVASLDPLLGRVACICLAHKRKSVLVEKTFYDAASEESLLRSFWLYIEQEQLAMETVTFNGLSWDLPFIYFRTMVYSIPMPWPDISLRRYCVYPHVDLMAILSWWQPYKNRGQAYIAMALGLNDDNTKDAMNGSQVHNLFSAGEHQKIQEYCMNDVKQLIEIYKKVYQYLPPPPRARAVSQGAY